MNAISLLEQDHRTVEAILDEFDQMKGERPSGRKKDLCEKLAWMRSSGWSAMP